MQELIRDEEAREVSFGPDRLSAALRGELRTLVERLIREELVEALGAEPYQRTAERRGYQHSPRERTITTGLGPVTLTVPRGRLFTGAAGVTEEWQSELLPRYARRTREVDAALMARLKRHFDDDAIIELTALIAFQNLSSKFNSALDVSAQGFCRLPVSRLPPRRD